MKPIPAGDFYNEFDPFAAEWLRRLIAAGEIPQGIVDERSIKNVAGADLAGFSQVHLFAGIAGWPLALRLAGWPAGRSVWTGSCPCQPYSSAGKGKGDSDERNLWPEMFRLIRERRPDTIFGEQVESAIGHGWLDGISRDLEGEGYAIGSIVLGAHSVGAPHIRQRLFWVANAKNNGQQQRINRDEISAERSNTRSGVIEGVWFSNITDGCNINRLADSAAKRSEGRISQLHEVGSEPAGGIEASGRLADTNLIELCGRPSAGKQSEHEQNDGVGRLQHAQGNGRQQRGTESIRGSIACGRTIGRMGDAPHAPGARFGRNGPEILSNEKAIGHGASGAWSDFTIIPCRDGKYRRVPRSQSEVLGVADGFSPSVGQPCADRFPLAPRSQGRVGRLKGYGNAIVPQVAADFIAAFLESEMVPA